MSVAESLSTRAGLILQLMILHCTIGTVLRTGIGFGRTLCILPGNNIRKHSTVLYTVVREEEVESD